MHYIFIKIRSWLQLLLEWCWSLVKLRAIQCLHNCLTNKNFESKIWKTVKIRERSENFHFQRERFPSLCIICPREGQPSEGGWHSGGVGIILLYIEWVPLGVEAAHYIGGESTKLGYIGRGGRCSPHHGKPCCIMVGAQNSWEIPK